LRLVPLGIYRPSGAVTQPPRSRSGTLCWHRELLSADAVRPCAKLLSVLCSPVIGSIVLALCLWVHMQHIARTAALIAYDDAWY